MRTRLYIPGPTAPTPCERAMRGASIVARCVVMLIAGSGAAALVIALASGVSLGGEAIVAAIGY